MSRIITAKAKDGSTVTIPLACGRASTGPPVEPPASLTKRVPAGSDQRDEIIRTKEDYINPDFAGYLRTLRHDDEAFAAFDTMGILVAGADINFNVIGPEDQADEAKHYKELLDEWGMIFDYHGHVQEVEATAVAMGNFMGLKIGGTFGYAGVPSYLEPYGFDIQSLAPENLKPKVDPTLRVEGWYYESLPGYLHNILKDQKEKDRSVSSKIRKALRMPEKLTKVGTYDDPFTADKVIHVPWRRYGHDILGFGLAHQILGIQEYEERIMTLLYLMIYHTSHGLLHARVKLMELMERFGLDPEQLDESTGLKIGDALMGAVEDALKDSVTESTATDSRTLPSEVNNILITADFVDLVALQIPNDIPGTLDTLKYLSDRKTRALRVPKFFTLGEGANRSTSEAQLVALEPLLNFERRKINNIYFYRHLLPILRHSLDIPLEFKVRVNHEKFIKDDEMSSSTATLNLVKADVLTEDEARDRHGLGPLPEDVASHDIERGQPTVQAPPGEGVSESESGAPPDAGSEE